ncbi:MAG: hypothetical protein WDO16_12080 [Bacteroidota bacterium]
METWASDKGRITRYTVNAIQADVYLWMEKYPECVTACNKIINSNQFGLIDEPFPIPGLIHCMLTEIQMKAFLNSSLTTSGRIHSSRY